MRIERKSIAGVRLFAWAISIFTSPPGKKNHPESTAGQDKQVNKAIS